MAEYTGSSVTIYYVDGENGDDNSADATTTGGAWETIQKAFDEMVAGNIADGDEVRIMSTSDDETYYDLGGAQQTGGKLTCTWSSKEVLITGANSSGVVDGTIVTIFGDSLSSPESTPMMEVSVGTADYTMFSHLKFDANDKAQHCVEATVAGSHNMGFINCQFTQAASHGVNLGALANYWNFINCRFDNNGDAGMYHTSSYYAQCYKCLFDNNVGIGARIGSQSRITECVFHNNGDDGMYISNAGAVVCNCVFDNNASDGVYVSGSGQSIFMDCLFTNNTGYGLVAGSSTETKHFNSAFYNNGTDSYYTTGTVHLSMFNYLDDVTTTYGVTADFDFTPNGASSVVGAGIPTHYKWMGATGSDIGLNKWVNTESISVF